MLTALVVAGASLLGVALGSFLTSRAERRSLSQRREWELADRRRDERRDIYVRFLNAADQAMHIAWETGRKRTSVRTTSERQQEFLDWNEARNDLAQVLTEVRLAAPAQVHLLATTVTARAALFGQESLRAGEPAEKGSLPKDHQAAYDDDMRQLIDAMVADLS